MTDEPDGPTDLVGALERSLAAVDADVHRCASRDEAHATVRALVAGVPVVADRAVATPAILDGARVVQDPWEAEVGITGVVAASAATGTLALAASPDTPRSTSLVPPVHVALVPHDRILADLPALFDALARLDPAPSSMQLISGPSRSGDIEMKLVRGVHGPATVHVVLHPDVPPE